MKTLSVILISIMLATASQAGRPIILSEAQVCSKAELVVIAKIGSLHEIPEEEPFGDSNCHSFGFTQFAKIKIMSNLLGKSPKKCFIYGGKLPAGTDYRLESGDFLLLLTKVGDGAFRAVDWHYSFMPVKEGKVSWLINRHSAKREWISIEEAKRRIVAHQASFIPDPKPQ